MRVFANHVDPAQAQQERYTKVRKGFDSFVIEVPGAKAATVIGNVPYPYRVRKLARASFMLPEIESILGKADSVNTKSSGSGAMDRILSWHVESPYSHDRVSIIATVTDTPVGSVLTHLTRGEYSQTEDCGLRASDWKLASR